MLCFFRNICLLLALTLACQSINAQAISSGKVSDTIPSFTVNREGQYVWGNPEMPDSSDILAQDTVNKIVVFIYGGPAYLAYYDETNKGAWPDTNNWITWPLFDDERFGYIDREFGDPFRVGLKMITISGKKLLQINWSYSTNGNRVWSEEGGMQIWGLKTKTCYFDLETSKNIYASGAGTESGESWTEACEIAIANKKNCLIVTQNTCGAFPHPGKYVLAADRLVRKK